MNDLISRQAAIDAFDGHFAIVGRNSAERFKMYIEAVINDIRKLPPAQLGTNLAEVGTDTISRQAAIDALKELTANGTNKGMVFGEDAGHRIEMLPPAQPQRTGKWIRNGWALTCSECGYDMPYTVRNFCPNCGAKMTEGDAE